MNHPKTIVLDSWAIMAYLEDEPAAEKIADMIADREFKQLEKEVIIVWL